MAPPRVSVVVPTYNSAVFLGETVESILAQSYQDFEVIIVDDGSTDDTVTVLAPYINRISYHYQENQGESVARNRAIQLAQGEYIAFLDSDDLWLPSKLERQIEEMDRFPQAVLAYAHSYLIDAAGNRISRPDSDKTAQGQPGLHDIFKKLLMSNIVTHPGTVMVRRQVLLDTGGFAPDIQWGEDWDLWLRLALRGPFVFIPEPLACYRLRKPGRRLQIEASTEFVEQNASFLKKIFELIPDDRSSLQQLKPQALEKLYLRSAFYNFELSNVKQGTHYLDQAIRANPKLLNEPTAFVEAVANQGFRTVRQTGHTDDGVKFIETIFFHLPAAGKLLHKCRAMTLSRFYQAAAFFNFQHKKRDATVHYVIQAIRAYPACLRNRGLLSIGARSFLRRKV